MIYFCSFSSRIRGGVRDGAHYVNEFLIADENSAVCRRLFTSFSSLSPFHGPYTKENAKTMDSLFEHARAPTFGAQTNKRRNSNFLSADLSHLTQPRCIFFFVLFELFSVCAWPHPIPPPNSRFSMPCNAHASPFKIEQCNRSLSASACWCRFVAISGARAEQSVRNGERRETLLARSSASEMTGFFFIGR